jgi:hypothetical protein
LAGCGQSERSQATRLGDRSRKRCAGQAAAHPGLTHWNVEPQSVRDVHASRRYGANELDRLGGPVDGLIFVAGVQRTSVIFTADGWFAASLKSLLHNRKVTK